MTQVDSDKILKAFFGPDGRLRQIPVKQGKLLVVLARLAGAFEPGRRYPEREVNDTIRRFHDDFCTLRRNLVDFRLLARADGQYWRVV